MSKQTEVITLRTEHKDLFAEEAVKAGVSVNEWINTACLGYLNLDALRQEMDVAAERDRLTLTLLAQTTAMVQQLAERADVDFDAVDGEVIAMLQDAGFEVEPQGEAA